GPSPATVRGAGALAAGAAAQAESVLRDEAVDGVGERMEPGHVVEPRERPQERAQPEQVRGGGGAGEHPPVRQYELHRLLARRGAHLRVAGEHARRAEGRELHAAAGPAPQPLGLLRAEAAVAVVEQDGMRREPLHAARSFMADSAAAAKSRTGAVATRRRAG